MKPRKDTADRGAGSGCMARLVRCSSFLVGLARLPHTRALVSPVSVGGAIESLRVYLEIIPHEISDIVRETLSHVPERRGTIDDAIGYESLNNAILDAEHVGARILCDVIPQNLLLVFGQTLKSLHDAFMEFPLPPKVFDPIYPPSANCYQKKDNRRQEKNPENCAVILCKLRKPESLLELRAAKKYETGHKSDSYKVAWSELQSLKDALYDSVSHGVSSISSTNVKEHAPLPAGASVDHGVVHSRNESENATQAPKKIDEL